MLLELVAAGNVQDVTNTIPKCPSNGWWHCHDKLCRPAGPEAGWEAFSISAETAIPARASQLLSWPAV